MEMDLKETTFYFAEDISLVQREEAQKIVMDRVDTIRRGGRVFQNIINFIGVVGIGKSTLLNRLLYEELKSDARLHTIFIDLSDEKYRGDGHNAFIEEITVSLPIQDYTVEHQFEAMKLFQPRLPLVLFLDTIEDASAELTTWLENEIIGPLSATERAVIVLAGRRAMRWRRFDVRNRVVTYSLQPFTESEIREQLSDSYSYIAQDVSRFSFGHPAADRVMVEEFKKLGGGANKPGDRSLFEQHKEMFISTLAQYIDRVLMAGIDEKLKYAIKTIAPVRQFDVNHLSHILSEFTEDMFTSRSGAYYLNVVRDMVRTTLVQWDSGKRGYALDDTVRKMLCLVMTFQDAARLVNIHRRAAELYGNWIQKVADNRVGFIVERLYHLVFVFRYENRAEDEIKDTLQTELQSFITAYCLQEDGEVDMSKIDELWHRLQDDMELADMARDAHIDLLEIVKGYMDYDDKVHDS